MKVWAPQRFYAVQPSVLLEVIPPASGTRYAALDTTPNVRVISVEASLSWTVQPTELRVYITTDSQEWLFTQAAPAHLTKYYAVIDAGRVPSLQLLTTTDYLAYKPFLIESRTVKVEAMVLGGTVDELTAILHWAKA